MYIMHHRRLQTVLVRTDAFILSTRNTLGAPKLKTAACWRYFALNYVKWFVLISDRVISYQIAASHNLGVTQLHVYPSGFSAYL